MLITILLLPIWLHDNMHHLLYKDKSSLSVLIFPCPPVNFFVSACICLRLGLYVGCALWHEQVCFYKFLNKLCWAQEGLEDTTVLSICQIVRRINFKSSVALLRLCLLSHIIALNNRHSMKNSLISFEAWGRNGLGTVPWRIMSQSHAPVSVCVSRCVILLIFWLWQRNLDSIALQE